MRTSPPLCLSPNFCVGFSCTMFDKKGWQLYAVAQLGLSWVLPTPTPVTQLAFCFSDSSNKGELGELRLCSVRVVGCVCDTLMTLGHFLDQRSRWLSLNITVSLSTNGISRLCCEEQRLVVWDTEGKMERPHLGCRLRFVTVAADL